MKRNLTLVRETLLAISSPALSRVIAGDGDDVVRTSPNLAPGLSTKTVEPTCLLLATDQCAPTAMPCAIDYVIG
jgi:hypothetical protein